MKEEKKIGTKFFIISINKFECVMVTDWSLKENVRVRSSKISHKRERDRGRERRRGEVWRKGGREFWIRFFIISIN